MATIVFFINCVDFPTLSRASDFRKDSRLGSQRGPRKRNDYHEQQPTRDVDLVRRLGGGKDAAGKEKSKSCPPDDVKMEHLVLSEPENLGIEKVLTNHCRIFEKALRRPSDKDLVTTFDGKIADGNMEGMIIQE
jgi:hypothetical protein